jgi:hypothetical protein
VTLIFYVADFACLWLEILQYGVESSRASLQRSGPLGYSTYSRGHDCWMQFREKEKKKHPSWASLANPMPSPVGIDVDVAYKGVVCQAAISIAGCRVCNYKGDLELLYLSCQDQVSPAQQATKTCR